MIFTSTIFFVINSYILRSGWYFILIFFYFYFLLLFFLLSCEIEYTLNLHIFVNRDFPSALTLTTLKFTHFTTRCRKFFVFFVVGTSVTRQKRLTKNKKITKISTKIFVRKKISSTGKEKNPLSRLERMKKSKKAKKHFQVLCTHESEKGSISRTG